MIAVFVSNAFPTELDRHRMRYFPIAKIFNLFLIMVFICAPPLACTYQISADKGIEINISEIEHVYFHPLIVDTDKAFNKEYNEYINTWFVAPDEIIKRHGFKILFRGFR